MDKEKIKQTIQDIFNFAGCVMVKCELNEEDDTLWCQIETPDSRFMIGRDGETLRSLNHIVKKIIDKDFEGEENNSRLIIDINGYQKKRFDNLKNIAHMMAERARYFKSNIEVDPMPAHERKVIHMFLENEKNIVTESEGYGPKRRVVIKYVE